MSAYDDTEPLTESETRCQKRHHPRIQPPPQASVMQDEENRFRFECECIYWLRDTGGDPKKVKAVILRITEKRGKAAADRLYQGMRDEWQKQQRNKKCEQQTIEQTAQVITSTAQTPYT